MTSAVTSSRGAEPSGFASSSGAALGGARVARAVIVTWLVTAVWDFVCASALSVFAYRSTVARLWQGVAATVHQCFRFVKGRIAELRPFFDPRPMLGADPPRTDASAAADSSGNSTGPR